MTRAARLLLAVVALAAAVLVPSAASAAERTVTYTVSTRGAVVGDLGHVAAVAREAFSDPRGWSLGGALAFQQVSSGSDFDLILASPSVIAAASPGCSAQWSCRVGRSVYINDERWRFGTASWPHGIDTYQRYVINHEVGHWIGIPHTDCPTPGRTAWVMQQQSISLQGCTANMWPGIEERAQAAQRMGVPVYWTLVELHYMSLLNGGIPLGPPTTWEYMAPDGGRHQHFSGLEGASIFWSARTGVHEIYGPIRDEYERWGWNQGLLGYPTTGQFPTRDGQYSHFEGLEGASIFWSPRTGTHEVYGPIRDEWEQWGWAEGLLGFPTSDQFPTRDGQYSHFEGLEGASIFWSPRTGTHEVYGPIRDKWEQWGWAEGLLGFPTSDQLPTGDGIGQYSHFEGLEGTSIYSSPATGVHEVYGPIRDRWEALGWEQGPLGYPTSDQLPTGDGIGQYSHFSGSGGASIFSTGGTGTHEVYGPIRDRWAELGWERSQLGYPVTGVQEVPGGSRVEFQGGSITLDAATGEIEVVLG